MEFSADDNLSSSTLLALLGVTICASSEPSITSRICDDSESGRSMYGESDDSDSSSLIHNGNVLHLNFN